MTRTADAFHPTRWTLLLRASGEATEAACSRADFQPLGGSEGSLPSIEAPEFRRAEKLPGGDEEDVDPIRCSDRPQSTPFHRVPEAQQKLAGGEASPRAGTTGLCPPPTDAPRRVRRKQPPSSPALPPGRIRLAGVFRWLRSFLTSPPANFRCASGAFSTASFAVEPPSSSAEVADQEAGVGTDHRTPGASIRAAHVLEKFLNILLCQHRFAGAIAPEGVAFRPVHFPFFRLSDRRDWLTFHNDILTALHPCDDGVEPGLQVVERRGFHVRRFPHRAGTVKA